MKLHPINCTQCGSQVDLDLDHLQAFCPYCGQKLLIDVEQMSKLFEEKEKTKRTLAVEETKQKIAQEETKRLEIEEGKKHRSEIIVTSIVLAFLLLFLILAGILLWKVYTHL